MPFKSSIFDYHLPPESINQNPYKDPNKSQLLIANTRDIITFENLPSIINTPSLFILNKSTVKNKAKSIYCNDTSIAASN